MPYDEYGWLGADRTFIWWNPDLTGRTNAVAAIVGKGRFMYPDGGKRYAYREFPTKAPKFFDTKNSIVDIPISDAFPGGVESADNPCGPACPCMTLHRRSDTGERRSGGDSRS